MQQLCTPVDHASKLPHAVFPYLGDVGKSDAQFEVVGFFAATEYFALLLNVEYMNTCVWLSYLEE